MKMHRSEEIWLIIAVVIIVASMLVTGYQTFAQDMGPPSGKDTLDPENVDNVEPFDEPGVYEVGEDEYEVVMVAQAFAFTPNEIEVPAGSTVHFTITSKDVIHGFQVPRTNINTMVVPGYMQYITQEFDEPGEYLALCNEYCGAGHEDMDAKIIVK